MGAGGEYKRIGFPAQLGVGKKCDRLLEGDPRHAIAEFEVILLLVTGERDRPVFEIAHDRGGRDGLGHCAMIGRVPGGVVVLVTFSAVRGLGVTR